MDDPKSGLLLGEKRDNLARPRVASRLRLLIHRNAVPEHLESSAARRYQLDVRRRISVTNLSRQTGSSGLVASKGAVLDGDFHSERSNLRSRHSAIYSLIDSRPAHNCNSSACEYSEFGEHNKTTGTN